MKVIDYIKAAKFFLGDRLLFGTAYPSRPLKESLQAFLEWDLSDELRGRILFNNAARVLGLH